MIEEQKVRLTELEWTVTSLRDKLTVSRTQLAGCTKLIPSGRCRISERTLTFLKFCAFFLPVSRSIIAASSSSTIKSPLKKKPSSLISGRAGQNASNRPLSSSAGCLANDDSFTTRVEQLLLEAKGENSSLLEQLHVTQTRLAARERELTTLSSRLQIVETNAGEEAARLREQLEIEQGI